MGIEWNDLVDVPEEAPERSQEPWEVYMTDRGCKAATERISAEQKVSLAEAAVIAARTVAPAPQNFAAHNARYLLAPEVEPEDETVLSREMGYIFGAEQFDAQARAAARRDGPISPQGRRYSEGLTNRAGELAEDTTPEPSGTYITVLRQRPGAPIPIPSPDDGPLQRLGLTQIVRESTLFDAFNNEELMDRIDQHFREGMNNYDVIPCEPVRVEIAEEPTFGGQRHVIRFSCNAVPANGRDCLIQFATHRHEEGVLTEEHVQQLRDANPCAETEVLLYGNVLSAISWPKHEHEGYEQSVPAEGLTDEFVSRFMELFFNEE